MFSVRVIPPALLGLLAACGMEELAEVEQGLVSCPSWACGMNGPSLNNQGFHELSESGVANAEGFRLGPLIKNNVAYTIRVNSHWLSATSASGTLSGSQLVGSWFTVTDRNGHAVKVSITGVAMFPIWGGPYEGHGVEGYRFYWTDSTTGVRFKNLCSSPPPDKPESSELLGLSGDYTLVYEGNRYDAERKLVLPGHRDWFNLACAGHALSKLFLTGHTSDSGNAPADQQQATLKMITADYCGSGLSFTVGGEPLYWKTANGYMDYYSVAKTVEARWSANGATCLGQPRLQVSSNPLAAAVFPDIKLAIEQACPTTRPPACGNLDVTSFDGQLAISSNPLNE